jgi:hypothetical protein
MITQKATASQGVHSRSIYLWKKQKNILPKIPHHAKKLALISNPLI